MAKKTAVPTPAVFKSDKEHVKSIYKDSVISKEKRFIVMSSGGINQKALHSGIAKTESDAWKLALHSIL